MTEPSAPRPVPGPPRPAVPVDGEATPHATGTPFTELAGLPVAEHVAVFEAEYARLQRELATIDQL